MKIGGVLVAFGQGQDFGLGIEFSYKGDGAGRPVFGEAIGQHHTGMVKPLGSTTQGWPVMLVKGLFLPRGLLLGVPGALGGATITFTSFMSWAISFIRKTRTRSA